MKKAYKVLFIIMIFLTIIMLAHTTKAIDTDLYEGIYKDPNSSTLNNVGSKILGIVEVVAAAVSVTMLVIIGVKYIMASPEGKADIKGKLTFYIIGAVLIFGGAKILTILISSFNQALK